MPLLEVIPPPAGGATELGVACDHGELPPDTRVQHPQQPLQPQQPPHHPQVPPQVTQLPPAEPLPNLGEGSQREHRNLPDLPDLSDLSGVKTHVPQTDQATPTAQASLAEHSPAISSTQDALTQDLDELMGENDSDLRGTRNTEDR